MRSGIFKRTARLLGAVAMLAAASSTSGANLLVNGDFESAPILGVGQTAVPPGGAKAIFTDPSNFFYDESISGIQGWTYAVPFENGTHSDHGLGRRNAEFGRFDDGQSVFINNWNRMMSQTVAASFGAGDVLEASIDFGTLGDDTDAGRAGRFYLVAGEADPADLDQFSARSVILAELSVANSTWTGFTPDVVVGNGLFTRLNLSYTVGASDLALGLPLTIAFRTVSSSVGPTWWDDASLSVRPIPEPSSLVLLTAGAAAFAGLAAFRRSRGCSRDRAEASRRATNE